MSLLLRVSWCLTLLLASWSWPGPARGAAVAGLDTLTARWTRWMELVGASGMAVAIVRDTGVVAIVTLGQRDRERGLPVTPDTRFYIASCTKPFVATAVHRLAATGRLDPGAPVRRTLPWFRVADAGLSDSITVADLIAHRHGLTSGALSFGQAFTGQMDEARFRRLLAQVQSPRAFGYSNVHYYVLGRVIESAAGRPWPRELESALFAPAGMTRTTCSASAAYTDSDVARPYGRRLGRLEPAAVLKTDRTMHAAGGMFSTARDLARWLRLELGGGAIDGRQVLPRAAVQAMRVPQVAVPDRHPLSTAQRRVAWAGWEVRTHAGDTLYTHNGRYTGYASSLSFVPGRGFGVAVLANGAAASVFLTEAVALDALDLMLGRAIEDPTPGLRRFTERSARGDTLVAATGRLTRPAPVYAGRYASADWGTLEVTAAADTLSARIGDLPLPLVMTGDDRFIADGDSPGRFEFDARGRIAAVWLQLPDSVRFERR
jgi:CubicO group peptidase (beta-lactamase class C family)